MVPRTLWAPSTTAASRVALSSASAGLKPARVTRSSSSRCRLPRIRYTTFCRAEVEGFDSLAELALDMRWSWNHATDDVWRQLDPALWELTHNPWVVLQTVSRDQIERVLADPVFRKTRR